MNRDYYPYGVYDAIYGLINEACAEGEYYNMDIIAWACDLASTTLDESQFDELSELEEYLNGRTTVLYADKGTVWHLVY